MNKASFLQRLMAWLADYIILYLFSFAITTIIGLTIIAIGNAIGGLSDPFIFIVKNNLILITFLMFVLLPFFYFGYFWSRKGQSIGMGLMGIQVIKTDGSNLSFWIAALRGTVGYWVSGLVFGLGYLWVFFDENQQTWHDKLFGTDVVTSK